MRSQKTENRRQNNKPTKSFQGLVVWQKINLLTPDFSLLTSINMKFKRNIV